MNTTKLLKHVAFFMLSCLLTACDENKGGQRIEIYVEPLYNSKPLKINVGEYSDRLKSNNSKSMLALADEIKDKIDEVDAVTLFVLAIRLYDLGEKDEAAYWYYNAQFRKNIFIKMVTNIDPTGAPAAMQSFKELSGKWINGYAYGNPDKLITTLEQVVADIKQMGYIAKAYPYYTFKPDSEQQAFVDEQIEAVREHIQYITDSKEEILRTRKENGIEGVY